jgi:hypothetical protein
VQYVFLPTVVATQRRFSCSDTNQDSLLHTRKNAQVVTGLQTSCYKSVHKLSTSCVRTACSQLLEQVWNKLLATCNKLDVIISKVVLTSLIRS